MQTRALGVWLVVLAAALIWPEVGGAVVGCQNVKKEKKLKLRAEECKPEKERTIFAPGDDPVGVWQWASGPPEFPSSQLYTEFLTLGTDGTGRLNARNRDSGVLECSDFVYARSLNGMLTLDPTTQRGNAPVWRGVLPSPDSLEISKPDASTTAFTRAASVDPDFECVEVIETRRFDGLPAPSSWTGLVWDGVSLWYTEDDTGLVHPVNPASGAPGVALDIGPSFNEVHAMQGGDFWVHCACGSVNVTERVTPAGVSVDTIDTSADLGDQISLNGIVRDDVGGVLWLFGRSSARDTRTLLEVDSDAEPDVLVSTVDVGFFGSSMTWDGTNFWIVSGTTILRIDPATGLAVSTWTLPDATVRWQGIAAVNGEIWVVGRINEEGVLVSVAP